MANTRGVDGRDQPSDLPKISPLATPLGFEPVTSALIPLVGPQALPTLLKAIQAKVRPKESRHREKCQFLPTSALRV